MSVFLVGAGPGDPKLITVRGLELIRSCEVLVYDRLVATELLDEAPPWAMRIARDELGQEQVNELLVLLGRDACRVVRLKGGDPFVFGRGGEEALALAAADIRFEVVPGVSALSAVPGLSGIPITHRGVSAHVTIASGHGAGGEDGFDAAALARAGGTLVLFMALGKLTEIAAALIEHGRDPRTPAAVIARGSHADQLTITAPLAELPERAAGLPTPALVVVGDVVALRDRLQPASGPGRQRNGRSPT